MPELPLLQGFSPIIGDRPGTLILGNMPSVMSLASGEYYGNPRNVFWRLAAELFGFDAHDPYPQRTASLCGSGIAVWDVLKHCRRTGSLDSAVERDSMVANDFATFFAEHPSIKRVYFNGAAAERNFVRLVALDAPLTYLRLPSTSPAQTMRYADKLAAWRKALCG
ncbi:DNA-deoxyinosine glycosylase [Mycolicibacterium sphagni]|uniref:DNA-deoxyinosine glycosylase n=1 Tax=Mycolicibacterium sphagni TaxID=1786 RepID=A0A255D6U8_9MYCO|nr:DNA-deoxyinosine glycosylase [Mycolicibacterium sphagni]OYN75119.1 DNA-deoxyinosine glycosylase [Mycolicibacterium sphagni]